MAGIDDLDPDRDGVEIALALPESFARVPGALTLGDKLVDRAVFPDKVVRRQFGGGIKEPLQRRLAGRHPGVVQDEAVGPAVASTLAAVGRGYKADGDRAVGRARVRHGSALVDFVWPGESRMDKPRPRRAPWARTAPPPRPHPPPNPRPPFNSHPDLVP